MSHRHKKNQEMKNRPAEQKFNVESVEIDPLDMEEQIMNILDRCEQNYACPRCQNRVHGYQDWPGGGTGFVCTVCGEITPVMTPIYLGEGHDTVMGYQITEFGKTMGEIKFHLIGAFPAVFVESMPNMA